MDITYYTDSDGFKVNVGQVMMWNEFSAPDGCADKYYVLEGLPDLGNMLLVREISDFTWNEQDGYKITDLPGSTPFEVEPWKMGAI